MEEVDEFGLIGVLLIGFFGIASMVFATMQIWSYLDRSPRWGRSTANVVTGLAVIPLLWGGWLVFDVLWLAKRAASLVDRHYRRAREPGNDA